MSGDDLNLPYEPVGGDPIPLDIDGHVCGGLIVRAAVGDTPTGKIPLIIFEFARADGLGFLPPIVLGYDDPHALVALVRDAVVGASQAAAS